MILLYRSIFSKKSKVYTTSSFLVKITIFTKQCKDLGLETVSVLVVINISEEDWH